MPRVHPIFANFTAGELSPLLYGRVEFEKYPMGLRRLENMIVHPHGPATRRAGTRFVAEVKNSAKRTYVLPFEFSTQQAYVIEFGENSMRFYKDGERIQLTVTSAVNNGSGPIRITTSVAHGFGGGERVVISGVTGTTEANGTWIVSFVDATHIDLQGSAFVNAYISGGIVVPDALTPYVEAQLPEVKYIQSADTMYLFHVNVAPQKLVRLSHTSWFVKDVRFLPPATYEDGCTQVGTTLTLGSVSGTGVTVTASAAFFLNADVGRLISSGDGRAIITGFTSTTQVTVDIFDTFSSTLLPSGNWLLEGSPNTQLAVSIDKPRHASCTLTLTAAGWRSGDVGRYVRVNKGVVRINVFTSTTVARGEIVSVLSGTANSPGGSWSIESSAWNSTRGYPLAGAFHEQRMCVAGSLFQSQSLWGSASADIENFGLAPDDDDAFEFKIAANDVNALVWLVPTRVLLMGTTSGEFTAEGSNDSAITPTNIRVQAQTAWGSSAGVRPLRIAHAGIFATRTGREVRELLFSVDRDSYVSNNLLILAEHLTRDYGVTEMAYQRTPHSTIWCIREDGVLLSCTYQRDHNVIAWGRHMTQGLFESITVIPHWSGDRDVPWLVVNRTVGGATKRFIEYFNETEGYYGAVNTDCGLTGSFGNPVTALSGLDHLNGLEVQIVGDGAVYPSKVVTAGSVPLAGPGASVVEVGLGYDSLLETMRPEVPVQGTSQGRMRHWSEILVRLDRSLGCFVNGDEIPFRSSSDDMDEAPPLFTGDHKINSLDRDPDGTITVEQRQPLPLTVVAVFGTLGVGD